jgi:hypothetical protein
VSASELGLYQNLWKNSDGSVGGFAVYTYPDGSAVKTDPVKILATSDEINTIKPHLFHLFSQRWLRQQIKIINKLTNRLYFDNAGDFTFYHYDPYGKDLFTTTQTILNTVVYSWDQINLGFRPVMHPTVEDALGVTINVPSGFAIEHYIQSGMYEMYAVNWYYERHNHHSYLITSTNAPFVRVRLTESYRKLVGKTFLFIVTFQVSAAGTFDSAGSPLVVGENKLSLEGTIKAYVESSPNSNNIVDCPVLEILLPWNTTANLPSAPAVVYADDNNPLDGCGSPNVVGTSSGYTASIRSITFSAENETQDALKSLMYFVEGS